MKKEDWVWDDFDETQDDDSQIKFEFEMDFGLDTDKEYYSSSDLEYDS
jgi:hypothetical protein